jgi:hypothetical protein
MPSSSAPRVANLAPGGTGLRIVSPDQGHTALAVFHSALLEARSASLPKRHEAPAACPDWFYNIRNRVERLWTGLNKQRATATRYGETAASFADILCLAATLDRLER